MARRVRYKENRRSFGEFMLSEQVRDPVAEVAHDIAKLASVYAPRRKSGAPPDGTAMADQFRVQREAGTMKVSGNRRVQVDVTNSARSAAPNEFGSKNNHRHRMLGRAGAAFGDFKPDGGLET
jgi:hypothetical protein